MSDPWLSLSELAQQDYCPRSIDTLRKHVRAKVLPATKDPVSGAWRVRESDARRVYGTGSGVPDAKARARKIHAQASS